jgi:hypothetical protein
MTITVALPTTADTNLAPPDADEVRKISHGIKAILTDPSRELTAVQRVLLDATFVSMTGHPADFDAPPSSIEALADVLRRRNAAFRNRIVQEALLGALVVDPVPPDVIARLRELTHALSTIR